jgi:hypothetical protein
MTEEEWLACDDLKRLLEHLRDRPTARKLRLFACGCCRLAWHLLTHSFHRRSVEVGERYADGLASREDLCRANDAESVVFRATQPGTLYGPKDASCAAFNIAEAVAGEQHPEAFSDYDEHLAAFEVRLAETAAQAALLKDIFGNPFHAVAISPSWLTWNDAIVPRLAQAAYDNCILPAGTLDNARPAVLADALEEAGCSDEQILGHLRSGGEHYRGCFVVDALLGKM